MMNGVITDMENGTATVATFIGQAAIELGTGVSPDGLCKTVYANRTEVINPSIICKSAATCFRADEVIE